MAAARIPQARSLCRRPAARGYATATQPFGALLRPREKAERLRHAEILGRVPYDMADSWFERTEILTRKRAEVMPEQFAEAMTKYSANEVDFALNALLTHCLDRDSAARGGQRRPGRAGHARADEERFIDDVLERLSENFENLNGAECGIVLKCLTKLNYGRDELKLKLVNKVLSRNEAFTKHGLVAALETLVAMINEAPGEAASRAECARLALATLAVVAAKLDRFEIGLIAKIVNIASRAGLNARSHLTQIANHIADKHAGLGEADAPGPAFAENDVYYLTNGFARSNVLNKRLFDRLGEAAAAACASYSVDTLAAVANAYSKFGNVADSGYLDLFCKVAERAVAKLGDITPMHAAVLANAFAKAGVCHEHLFKVLLDKFALSQEAFTPRQAAMVLHSATRVQYRAPNMGLMFHRAFQVGRTHAQELDAHGWHSLAMLFQAYVKSDHVDEDTTNMFCDHILKRLAERGTGDPGEQPDEFNKVTPLSLVYSLVKIGSFRPDIFELAGRVGKAHAQEILARIDEYAGDELVNLVYAFCKMHGHARKNQLE